MKPDFTKLIKTYTSTDNILVASVECETADLKNGTGSDLCDRLFKDVQNGKAKCSNDPGYPNLCYGPYSNEDEYKQYPETASTKCKKLLKFVEKHLGPAVEETDLVSVEPALEETKLAKHRREIQI